jgi:hypothetical protein
MKPKTVILLAIVGSLLLFVGAFAIYCARGGEVLYRYPYSWTWGYLATVPIEQEETAKEIAALDFTFRMSPEIEVTFKGSNPSVKFYPSSGQAYQVLPVSDAGFPKAGRVVGEIYVVSFTLQLDGYIRYSIPFENQYIDFTEEEFLERLTSEIQSRISPDAEFEVKDYYETTPWKQEGRHQLKTLPRKPK